MQRENPPTQTLRRLPDRLAQAIRRYAEARDCDLSSALAKARELVGDHAETTMTPEGGELLACQEAAKRLEVACLRYVRAKIFEGVDPDPPQFVRQADLHIEFESRDEEIEELEQELAVRDRKIEKLQAALERKEQDLSNLNDRFDNAQSRAQDLKQAVEARDSQIDALNDENEDLREELDGAEERIEELEKGLEQAEENLNATREEYREITRSGQERREELEEENERLRSKLAEAGRRIQELESGAESSDAPDNSPADHDEGDESAPNSPHEWQSATELADKLDTNPQTVGVTASHYERGNDVEIPIEAKREGPDEKLFRVVPDDSDDADDEDATYLVGDEVPGGVVLEEAKDSLESAKRYADSQTYNHDDTCDPVILRVTGSVPKLEQRIKWGVIESKDSFEVVQ